MAIDTAEKRRSVAGIHLMAAGPGVTPNSDQDQEWRQQVGYGYSGILVAVAVVAVAAPVEGGLLVFPPIRRRGPSLEVRREIADTVVATWEPYVAEVNETLVSGRPVHAGLQVTVSAPDGIRYADAAAVEYAMLLSASVPESLEIKERVQPVWNMRQVPVPLETTLISRPAVEIIVLSKMNAQRREWLIRLSDEMLGI